MCQELKEYCEKYGRQKSLADSCQVTPQAVTKWLKKGVPPRRVLDVEVASGIPCHLLRPDIYKVNNEVVA